MLFYFFLLFIVLPLVEIAILVRIGESTVWWVPLAIVIVTGIAGTLLARWQGLKVLERIRDDIRAGRVPADALIDGFLVLLAGMLFVMPGVLTDVVGIAFLIPPIRALVKRGTRAWIKKTFDVRMSRVGGGVWPNPNGPDPSGHDQIIDVKVLGTRVEDAKNAR